jgi:hypothetical protein
MSEIARLLDAECEPVPAARGRSGPS